SRDLALKAAGRERRQATDDVERVGLVRQLLRREILRRRRWVIGRALDRSPGRCADRRDEVLLASVPELQAPGNGPLRLLSQRAHTVPERCEVGVAARVDRVLRAGLHARVALP